VPLVYRHQYDQLLLIFLGAHAPPCRSRYLGTIQQGVGKRATVYVLLKTPLGDDNNVYHLWSSPAALEKLILCVAAKLLKEGFYDAPIVSLIILPSRSGTICSGLSHTSATRSIQQSEHQHILHTYSHLHQNVDIELAQFQTFLPRLGQF
jgi:hypothetical protein